jgi:hypothetical protein
LSLREQPARRSTRNVHRDVIVDAVVVLGAFSSPELIVGHGREQWANSIEVRHTSVSFNHLSRSWSGGTGN